MRKCLLAEIACGGQMDANPKPSQIFGCKRAGFVVLRYGIHRKEKGRGSLTGPLGRLLGDFDDIRSQPANYQAAALESTLVADLA
jgi:hypothetical protein